MDRAALRRRALVHADHAAMPSIHTRASPDLHFPSNCDASLATSSSPAAYSDAMCQPVTYGLKTCDGACPVTQKWSQPGETNASLTIATGRGGSCGPWMGANGLALVPHYSGDIQVT